MSPTHSTRARFISPTPSPPFPQKTPDIVISSALTRAKTHYAESGSDPKQAEATAAKPDSSSSGNKPLAPPPRPGQAPGGNTPDYFSNPPGSLNLEPNPFDQSFGAPAPPETPGGTKLPPVASLASPSSLLPGTNQTPFTWGGGSLRTGPLSPAMISGPTTNDYFGDAHHIRGFPTPNESSMRTGLTPGGGGSMFPASSPGSQAVLAQLASSGATPGTLDFHRTALSAAAAAKREQQQTQPQQQQQQQAQVTSQPQDMSQGVAPAKTEAKASVGHFDPHDNDAANGLYLLANGRNNSIPQAQTQYAVAPQQQIQAQRGSVSGTQSSTSPQMAKGNAAGRAARGASEAGSAASDESEQARPNTRGKGKRNSNAAAGAANGRRKAEEQPSKAPASKKAKTNGANANNASADNSMDMEPSDEEDDSRHDDSGSKSKMTDEEKRKNFLERNRYDPPIASQDCVRNMISWLLTLLSILGSPH